MSREKSATVATLALCAAILLPALLPVVSAPPSEGSKRIAVKIKTSLTREILDELSSFGIITHELYEINVVGLKAKASDIPKIAALDFVEYATPDVRVYPFSFVEGFNTWNLDMIDVTGFTAHPPRTVAEDGTGIYVAVIDSGLVKNWRDYFQEDSIVIEYAKAFVGGGGERGRVANPPNYWERDTISHGTHVTSIILGYRFYDFFDVNGVAPKAKIIPVRVIGNGGFGWGLDSAEGILYVASLAEDPEMEIVINLSIGSLDPFGPEQDAINQAISNGVIVVAAAGNEGEVGMGYPAAYPEVISVAAVGWKRAWTAGGWWYGLDVPEEIPAIDASDRPDQPEAYVVDFSSRMIDPEHDLDVAAPGVWVVGPYLAFGAAHIPIWANGQPGQYYFVAGTSQASPHVAGIAALMLQKDPTLIQTEVESILEDTALDIIGGTYTDPILGFQEWDGEIYDSGAGLVQADAALAELPLP